jgi:hypothetical protein
MAGHTEPVEFERGDKVNHPKWGIGTILYKSGAGDHSKVIVLFQDAGQKTLAVKFAKLEKISSSPSKAKKGSYEDAIPRPIIPDIPVGVEEETEKTEIEELGEDEDEEEEEEL